MIEKSKLVFIILVFFMIVSVFPAYSDEEEPAFVMGIRKLGMGGVSVATANDEDLFFSNPAVLSWIKSSIFSSFDLKSGFNPDSVMFLKRLFKYHDDSFSELTRTEIDNLNNLEPLYKLSGPLNITYMRRHFGFGLFATSDLIFSPSYNTQSSIRLGVQQDIFGMFSFARDMEFPPQPSRISVGATLKYIRRVEVDQDMSEIDVAEIGRAFGLDVGMLYKVHDTYALGLMIRDALSSRFLWDSRFRDGAIRVKGSADSTKIQPIGVIGVSYTPFWEIPHILKDVVLAFDVYGFRYPKFGTEVSLYRLLRLRFGISNEGIALGLGLKLDIFALDYAFVSRVHDKYAGDIDDLGHFISMTFRL